MFKSINDTLRYRVHDFIEEHNHPLNHVEYRHISNKNTLLDYLGKFFIHQVSNSNVGATIVHQFYSNIKGGYKLVKRTKVDFKKLHVKKTLKSHVILTYKFPVRNHM